jgi:glucosamine-6-phosphate deaminase
VVLLATGSRKADIVMRVVTGEPSEKIPASVLQRHGSCRLLLDREASARLPD